MANNSAVLQPQSYPYRIATAPMNNPSPKIDFSIPKLSRFNRIESRWRILPRNHTRINPSAFPISRCDSKLFAVIRKNGPNVCSRRLIFWASPAARISAIVGNSSPLGAIRAFGGLSDFDGSGNWKLGLLDEDEEVTWNLVRALWIGEKFWGIRGIGTVSSIDGGRLKAVIDMSTWSRCNNFILFIYLFLIFNFI